MDVFFKGIERTVLIQVNFLIGCRVYRSEIADCKKDPIGGKVIYFDPNVLIEGVYFMKSDVRGKSVPYIAGYTTKTPSRGFLIPTIPKCETVEVRDPRFIMLPCFN